MKTQALSCKFEELESVVRFGAQPDCPSVLIQYINTSEYIAQHLFDKKAGIEFHYRIAHILLETICDTCIARHWRVQCLDISYRPLLSIQRLLKTPTDKHQFLQFRHEFSVLCDYFL